MSDQNTGNAVVSEFHAAIARNRGWFIALGAVLVVLGIVAIAFPLVTTIAAKIALGWVFLVVGIGHLVHSFSVRVWKGVVEHLLIGALYVVVGGWLAFFPLTGIIGLTLLLALTFIAEGVLELIFAFKSRENRGWLWFAFSGVIAIAAGALIAAGLPSTAVWAIGLLVGINVLSSGISFLLLATAAKAE